MNSFSLFIFAKFLNDLQNILVNKFEHLSKERQNTAKVNDFFGSERKILFNEQSRDIFKVPSNPSRKRGEVEKMSPEKKVLSFENAKKKILEIENEKTVKSDISFDHYVIALLTVGSTVYTVFFL